MNTLVRPGQRGLFPELFDWLETPFTALRPHGQTIRFEEYTQDDRYVLRAELPGIDPDKDVEVSVSGGVLTVHGQRHGEQREGYRTEFRYGMFTRSIVLPPSAYGNGILEVSVALKEPKEATQRITVQTRG